MRLDRDLRSTDAFVRPRTKLCFLNRHHIGLSALLAVDRKRAPATLAVGLVPTPNGDFVQTEHLCVGLADALS